MATSGVPWGELEATIRGEVVLDPEPSSFNARFHHLRAQAVVRCASAEDVAAALAFVRRHEQPFVVRSGGHCFAGLSSTRGVVVDVSPMDQVRLDGQLVTIGAGARLGPVYDHLQQHGRAVPAGTCPTVGVAGLTLAGGLGILGRCYGLTSDRLVSAEVVLADGRVVACDEDHEPDLFWALRGAGAANFGVVTSFVLRTVPAPPTMVDVHLAWSFDAAADAVAAWQKWAPAAPGELAASLKVVAAGDPDSPPTVNVYAASQAGETETGGLVDDLVRHVGADPEWRRVEALSFADTRRFWAQLPPPGTDFRDLAPPAADAEHPWFVARSEFFRQPLPGDAIARLLEDLAADRQSGEERELDFMPWGGAYNRVPADATAFVHRDARFQLKHSAAVDPAAPAAVKDRAQAFVQQSWETAHPWASGGVFPAFPDRDLTDAPTAYYGANLPRLRRVKARYDPTDLVRGTLSPA